MPPEIKQYVVDPVLHGIALFAGCSAIGWASMVWANKPMPRSRMLAGAFLSGVAGLVTAGFLWSRLQGDWGLLMAASCLAGVGGASLLDLLLAFALRKAGLLPAQDEEHDNGE